MPRPICVPCKGFYRPKQNDIVWTQGSPGYMSDLKTVWPEISARWTKWRPWRVWSADLWECPACHHQLVTGHGRKHLAEHYEHERFSSFQSQSILQVDE